MKFFVNKYGARSMTSSAAVHQQNGHRPSLLGSAVSSLLSMSCKSTSAVVAEMRNHSQSDSDSDAPSPRRAGSRRTSLDNSVSMTSDNVGHGGNDNNNNDADQAETECKTECKTEEDSAAAKQTSTSNKKKRLSMKTLELAINFCQMYVSELEHCDLDVHEQVVCLLIVCT